MKIAKFTKLERRVGEIASRRAHRQLMQVPWESFHRAYEEYIRWQAFVLWARAIIGLEGGVPPWLKAILRKSCPGFAEKALNSIQPELLGLQLLRWVHDRALAFAKQEGWLDALVFYGFRDARSQGYWAYCEHCESEWKKRRPAPVPRFVQWRRSALNWKLHGDVSCHVLAKAVEKYIDFEAVVYWLRPLLETPNIQMPAHVARKLGNKYPGLLPFVNTHISTAYEGQSRSWQRLFSWGKDHVLPRAKKEGWLDTGLRQARIHPRHVRMANYMAFWRKSRVANPASSHPSFREWQRDAERYVRTNRN